MDDKFEDRAEEYAINSVANTYSYEQLLQIREKLEKQGEDLDLINKSIQRKTEMKRRQKERQEQEDIKFRKSMKKAAFWGFLSGLFGGSSSSKSSHHDLTDWEVQELNKNNYEPMNFEEEDMDEDDFYSDDLD